MEASYATPIVTTLQIKHDLSVTNKNGDNSNQLQNPENVPQPQPQPQPQPNPFNFVTPPTIQDRPFTDVPKKLIVSE